MNLLTFVSIFRAGGDDVGCCFMPASFVQVAMTLDIGLCVAFRANDVDAEHWFMPVPFLHVLIQVR